MNYVTASGLPLMEQNVKLDSLSTVFLTAGYEVAA